MDIRQKRQGDRIRKAKQRQRELREEKRQRRQEQKNQEEEGEEEGGGMMGGLFGGNKKDEDEETKNKGDKDKEGGMMDNLFGGKKKEEEEKKEKPDPMTKPIEWGNLANSIVTFFIELCILFIIGSRVVFAGKIAQFNILPTDIECMPYHPTFDDKESPKYQSNTPEANIDYMYVPSTEGSLAYATKIMTEITEKSRKNSLLDKMRYIEYDPDVNSMMKYIMACLTNIFVFFYGITNTIYGSMNKYLNESLVLLLGPTILSLLLLILVPLAVISTLIICIVNFKWLLKENMNRNPEYSYKQKIPVWRDLNTFGDVPSAFATFINVIFGIFVVCILAFTPVPIFIGLYCFFLSPLHVCLYC